MSKYAKPALKQTCDVELLTNKGRTLYRIKRENLKLKHIPGGRTYILEKKNTAQEM